MKAGGLPARWWLTEWATYLWAALGSSILMFGGLRLWHLKIGIPLYYSGDALATGAHFKTVLSQGWFEYEPQLGAPTGELYYDFPQADNFHLIAAKVLGLFSSQWPVVMNVYFLIGFPLTALAAVWFLRVVGVSRILSIVLAGVYAIAPYHFQRNEAQLYLASYYPIPLALVLLVWIFRGEPIWTRRSGVDRWWGIFTGRGAAVVLILALLGTASQYYSVFFLILLSFTGIVTLIRLRSWQRFWGAVVAGLVVVVVMIINVLPNALYSLAHGTSIGTLDRSSAESEIYAFKLAQLLLPWPDHMIAALRNLRFLYDTYYPLPSEEPALGFIAAIGLVAAFLIIAYLVVGWRSLARNGLAQQSWFRTSTELSSLLFVAFLFGTVGGLSTLISYVTPDMRGWNRIAIVMSMLCLAIVGLLLDRAIWRISDKLRGRKPFSIVTTRRVVATAIAGILVVVGFIDQTPFNASSKTLQAQGTYTADQRFFAALQGDLPAQSMVLQLPYIRFPEDSAPNGTLGNDELIPFLHTSTIRWTAGGIKGRPAADWPDQVSQYDTPQMVTLAAAANMSGILLDTYAYDDQGRSLISSLSASLGEKPMVSSSSRWVFFDIRKSRAALLANVSTGELRAVASNLTDPVMPYMAPDFNPTVTTQRVWGGTSTKPAPRMTLVNPAKSTAHGTLSMLIVNNSQTGTAVVTLPDGSRHTVPITNGAGNLSVHMNVPPGDNTITVSSSIDGAQAPLVISHVHFESDLVAQFLAHVAS